MLIYGSMTYSGGVKVFHWSSSTDDWGNGAWGTSLWQ